MSECDGNCCDCCHYGGHDQLESLRDQLREKLRCPVCNALEGDFHIEKCALKELNVLREELEKVRAYLYENEKSGYFKESEKLRSLAEGMAEALGLASHESHCNRLRLDTGGEDSICNCYKSSLAAWDEFVKGK
jgi:hypothetical protein